MNGLIPRGLVWVLGLLLAVFVGMLVVEKGSALSDKFQNKKPQNTISVSAEGRVEAVPDKAVVSLGVFSEGKTAEAVKEDSNRKTKAVIDYVKNQGVDEKYIKTTTLSLNPQQDWTSGRATIVGYTGNQTVSVEFMGIDKSQDIIEKVLDGAVAAGANQVYGPTFSFSDPDNLKQEARKKAIAKAKEKANELAAETGLTLGKIVSVSESGGSGYTPPMFYGKAESFSQAGLDAVRNFAPEVEPGQQEVTQIMTVVFEVK